MNTFFNSLVIILSLVLGTSCNAMHEKISSPTKQESAKQLCLFERGEGFWSNPSDETKNNFFDKLTEPKSQREDWYKVSPYIAEFWCTVSNIGFLYVGAQNRSPELLCAGLASITSHTIPKEWLLTVDKICALAVVSKVIREHKIVRKHPWLLIPVGCAGLIKLADVYLARTKGKTWPHVVWHLSSAALAHLFLQFVDKQK